MELNTLGEFGLIDLIQIPAHQPEQLVLGIGDDCAVLPFDNQQYQLVSCDLLMEDVHFIRSRIDARQLGYKAVAVNLSDVAAMGGKPVHITLSMALPDDYTVEEWQSFYQGVEDICEKYQVNVIGGDTTSSKRGLAINVTVLGLVERENLHLRRDAKLGDVVFVTGSLGGSRAGLELILRDDIVIEEAERQHLLQCHCQPEPCCKEIQVLNRLAGEALHGLNDISDGLLSESSEIAEASNVALILQAEQIPVDVACAKVAAQAGKTGLQWALTGGEDYQLVGTMDAAKAEEICARYVQETGKQIYIVGKVEAGSGVYLEDKAGRQAAGAKGYNHFAAQTEATDMTASAEDADFQAEDEVAPVAVLLQERLQQLEQQEEQLRSYRHDLQNHLACLSGLLECGQAEQAQAYLQQMIAAVPQKTIKQYSVRSVVNILLNQKAQLAQQKGLDCELHCADDALDFLSDYEVCTLLGNLLDNGLEHSHIDDEAYLYLDIWTEENATVVRQENSCAQPPAVQNGVFSSCKADAAQHGKGMAQIRRLTERHQGQFSWEYDAEQRRFITQCTFPIIS